MSAQRRRLSDDRPRPPHVTAAPAGGEARCSCTVAYDASGSFIYALPALVPLPPSRIVRKAAIPFGGF